MLLSSRSSTGYYHTGSTANNSNPTQLNVTTQAGTVSQEKSDLQSLALSSAQKVLLELLGQTVRKVFTTQTMGHKNPVKGEKIFDVIRIGFKLDI